MVLPDLFNLNKKPMNKVKSLLIIFLLTCAGIVSYAYTANNQILDKEITIRLTNVPLEKALWEIGRAVNVRFAYSLDQLAVQESISVVAEKRTLREVLDEMFKPLRIQYKVLDRDALITLKKINAREQSKTYESYQNVPGSERQRITGVVVDEANQPMPGVNIIVKGTTQGTTSDVSGRYSIDAEENDVLVFSFIGYAPVEVTIGSQSTVEVIMKEDIRSLDEVVVNAGYWKVKEREQTGNISRVTSTEIKNQPVSNPLQAIQGRMTGVYVQQNTGMPGGGFTIQIRGKNSLRDGTNGTINGNLPLYLVDGVPFTATSLMSPFTSNSNLGEGNPLSTINPDDIESIEVLKDADATAIYGSRGANGVVLITTKKAKVGRTNVNVDFSSGVGKVANEISLLKTEQYLAMRHEALKNDGYDFLLEYPDYDVYWPDLKMWDTTRYTNWQRELIGGTAQVTNAQLAVSGGNSNTQFSFGGAYYRESTVFPGSNSFQRASGRLNLNHTTNDNRFNVNVSLTYSSSYSQIPTLDFTSTAVTLSPNAPALYDDQGQLNWENGTWSNPLAGLERKYKGTINNLVANTSLRYTIAKGLQARMAVGYSTMLVDESTINPLKAYDPVDQANRTGSSAFNNAALNTWILEPQLEYAATVGKGNLSLLAGGTMQESIQQGETLEATGYTNDALLENIDAAAGVNIIGSAYTQYRYAAFFARANYNWQDKYILNLTGRRDGSSRFGPGHQWATFGAIGAAWIFTNETWLKNIPLISFGKLRASYGSTGSDAIGNYQYLSTYSATPYRYNATSGLMVTRLGNPDYSWESNRKIEGAVDLGFLQDHVMLSAAYYHNQSSNQLVGFPLPVMTGQANVQYNLPATVVNRGWEFMLNTVNIDKGNVHWTSSINVTLPDNELTSFPDLEKYPAYNYRYEVGKSVFTYKALEYTGVDPETGVYTFRDVNQDGSISTSLDRVALKERTQQAYGGFNNSVSWKGIRLEVFFQWVKQTAYKPGYYFLFPGAMSNQPAGVMDRWQQTGDQTDVQRFTAFDPDGKVTTAFGYYNLSDEIIEDASFIRLKNVSLSWELPDEWIQKLKMENCRVYLQGQNIFTFTRYKGLDPETQSLSLPPLRMLTAGLQLTF